MVQRGGAQDVEEEKGGEETEEKRQEEQDEEKDKVDGVEEEDEESQEEGEEEDKDEEKEEEQDRHLQLVATMHKLLRLENCRYYWDTISKLGQSPATQIFCPADGQGKSSTLQSYFPTYD